MKAIKFRSDGHTWELWSDDNGIITYWGNILRKFEDRETPSCKQCSGTITFPKSHVIMEFENPNGEDMSILFAPMFEPYKSGNYKPIRWHVEECDSSTEGGRGIVRYIFGFIEIPEKYQNN